MRETETAVLIGCITARQNEKQLESSLRELSLLTQTAQVQAVKSFNQKREKIDPAYYIGKGKLDEVRSFVEEQDIDAVIFNDELSPSQLKNIEQALPCKVLDRTQLILDIFAQRAKSKEGQLQVELAQYRYLLPRIVGRGTAMSRLGGGIGTRGPGETKLETDRRHIRRRIREIEQALAKIVAHRQRYRERRKKNNVFQVALVGYTNAGKSTLLARLTETDVYIQDQLFATLDPTSKQLKLPTGLPVLVTDTVGFIQDLPTALIAAFRSTLEEVKEADLILHIIDSHDEQYQQQCEVVESLLRDLGAEQIPTVRVYNKRDLPPAADLLMTKEDLYISATQATDLERLRERVTAELLATMKRYILEIPAERGDVLAECRQQGFIRRQEWNEEGNTYLVEVYIPQHHPLAKELERIKRG
jgi:GTP-binding protein HflX